MVREKVYDDHEEALEKYGENDFIRLYNFHDDINKLEWKFKCPY